CAILRYCLSAVLSHSVSFPFVFHAVNLQVTQNHHITRALTAEEAFETLELLFREMLMLQNVYCVHVDAALLSKCLPRFLGKGEMLSRAASPTCALNSTARETCLALAMPWCYLLNTCGQDLSLKNNRVIIQLLKGLGGKNITPRVLPPPHVTTCTKYVHREQFYSSFSFMLWAFDQHVLNLLAWPKDTSSPVGHSWMMPCRILGEHDGGNGLKLKKGRFRLHIRKKFFIVVVVWQRNRLPREVVNGPSLEVFKARLDGALRNLV
uniref:Uncharacterized protein n=1 Tax=Cyanoderma ruficeps TaxID=181631 RepID=A0A8C3QK94_9PASS